MRGALRLARGHITSCLPVQAKRPGVARSPVDRLACTLSSTLTLRSCLSRNREGSRPPKLRCARFALCAACDSLLCLPGSAIESVKTPCHRQLQVVSRRRQTGDCERYAIYLDGSAAPHSQSDGSTHVERSRGMLKARNLDMLTVGTTTMGRVRMGRIAPVAVGADWMTRRCILGVLLLLSLWKPGVDASTCHLDSRTEVHRRFQAIKAQFLSKLGMKEPPDPSLAPDVVPRDVMASYHAALKRRKRRALEEMDDVPIDEHYYGKRVSLIPVDGVAGKVTA